MHPVIQFLSHMFGGGQPQAQQQKGSMPDHGPIGPPSGFISPVNNGLVDPVHQGINPLDLRNQQQPQVDPRQVAMHHIGNMMNSYNQLQYMMPKAPAPVPNNGQQITPQDEMMQNQEVGGYDNAMMNYNNDVRGTGQRQGTLMPMQQVQRQPMQPMPMPRR